MTLFCVGLLVLLGGSDAASATSTIRTAGDTAEIETLQDWVWPVSPVQIAAPYVQPPHRYGAGHRGIDLVASSGMPVVAPADGVVAFVGAVVDRPLITIDHGNGLVTTLEPVTSTLKVGDTVTGGSVVGTVSEGGHVSPGNVHFGVRLDGEYINPMLLLGGIPRAILLPCC